MIKQAFITETKKQTILSTWQAKQSLLSRYGYMKDNPIIKKAKTIFVSSIVSSGYSINYSIKLNITESLNELNSYLKEANMRTVRFSNEQFPSEEKIDKIIERVGMKPNRKAILAQATKVKKLLKVNNQILDIITSFLENIEIETVIELVLEDMYFTGVSFWYINQKNRPISLEYIPFDMIMPSFKQKGDLFVLDGWNIVDMGQTIKKLKLEDVLVFNNMSTIEYPGQGVLESIYLHTSMLDEDLVDLRTQRATRSGVKLLHYPDLQAMGRKTPLTEDEMKEYKKINKLHRNSIKTDYFSNGLWKIDVLKADDTIDNISDIAFVKELMENGLLVPHGLIDSGTNVNRSTLDVQIAYYITIVYTIANDISQKLTYLVKNYISDSVVKKNNVSIQWKYTEPQSLLDKAKMMAYLKNQFIQMPMYKLVTDVMKWDWDSFLQAVKKDEEYLTIYNSLPEQPKQIQAPADQTDPKNSHNNLTKK